MPSRRGRDPMSLADRIRPNCQLVHAPRRWAWEVQACAAGRYRLFAISTPGRCSWAARHYAQPDTQTLAGCHGYALARPRVSLSPPPGLSSSGLLRSECWRQRRARCGVQCGHSDGDGAGSTSAYCVRLWAQHARESVVFLWDSFGIFVEIFCVWCLASLASLDLRLDHHGKRSVSSAPTGTVRIHVRMSGPRVRCG